MIIDTLNRDTHYFTLDLHNGAILSEPLNFKQYDERSRELAIELTVHNKPLDLTNSRVDIWVYKKDGHTVVKAVDKANTDVDNSIVVIPLTRQMLILPPSVECEIVVTYADKRVLSFPIFEVTIERSNVDMDTVVSTSEFQLFYDALYRMEQWMRDYLDKYATIDQAFTTKLAALTLALQTVNAEWEQLKLKLSQDNQTNFNTFKQEQTAEMKKFYNQYHKFYTEQCVAIQEKLNKLQADIEYLEAETNRVLKLSQDNANIIIALREQCQTLHTQITQIKADADAKLAEMTRRFAEMEEEFTNNEAERQATFVNNESNLENPNSRQSVFNANEAQRQATFNNNESNLENPNSRQSVFNANEEARQATFNTNETTGENSRQKVFERNEATRQSTFNTSQANRAEDFEGEQTDRAEAFKLEQDQRKYAFDNAQTARDNTFKDSEKTRKSTFETNEATRQSTFTTNENTRQQNETTRQSNENTRQQNETTRQSNEDARVIAESARVTAEESRVNVEATRVATEQSRVEAEATRESNENTRISNESTRQSQETTRQSQESTRQTNETERQSQETTRQANETTRQTSETNRVSAESSRATAETSRVNAESSRVSAEETRVSEFEQMKQDFNTFLQYRYIEE